MSYWRCELFEEDLIKLNYIELAEWLIACRKYILYNTFNTYEEYINAVDLFCKEWEEHYRQNTKLYASHKFKKALLFATFENRLFIKIDFDNGVEDYPINSFSHIKSYNMVAWKKSVLSEIERSISLYYADICEIFKESNKAVYKSKLHTVISEQRFNKIEVNIRAFKEGKKVQTLSFDEFLKYVLNSKDKDYVIIPEKRYKKANYNKALESFGIPKTLYNEFRDEHLSNKEFDKKMFVNLAFALGLSYLDAEKLLRYNGYTMRSNERRFDIICKKAFQIGFSREMVIALIEKRNLEYTQGKTRYNPIPNITSQRH